MTMIKYTVSGSYRDQSGPSSDVHDFEDLEIFMPEFHEIGREKQNVMRMLPLAITNSSKCKHRFETLNSFYIDKKEVIKDMECPMFEKDIKEMEWEDLQHLAISKNLRTIPLYRQTELRLAREKAYQLFCSEILGISVPEEEFFGDWPELKVGSQEDAVVTMEPPSNNDVLKAIQKVGLGSEDLTNMTLKELKAYADKKGVAYHPNIGYTKLLERLAP